MNNDQDLEAYYLLNNQWQDIVVAIGQEFAVDNPKFNQQKFLEWCGYYD